MAEYTYKQLGIPLDLNNWESLNDNFKTIARDLNNLSGDVLASVIDGAKLTWQEPVDTFADLATVYPEAEEGWTVYVRNSGVNGETYRYDGSSWLKIQDFDATAINEVDSRLTSQLAEKANKIRVVVNVEDFGAKGDGVTNDTDALNEAINSVTENALILFPGEGYLYDSLPNLAKRNVTYRGIGSGITKMRYTGVGTAMTFDAFASGSPTDPFVDNCNLEGISVVGETMTVGIMAQGVSRSRWRDIRINGSNKANGTIGLNLRGCMLNNYSNIFCSSFDGDVPYRGIFIQAGTRAGVSTGGCSNNLFEHIYPEGNAIGLQIASNGGDQNVFSVGAPEKCSHYGLLVGGNCRYNTFIGLGCENLGVINADIDDSGIYSKFINCYSNEKTLLKGKGTELQGGFFERVEITSTAEDCEVRNITVNHWNTGQGGFINAGKGTRYQNVYDADTSTYLYKNKGRFAVTVTGSPFQWTNTENVPVKVRLIGGTVTQVLIFRGTDFWEEPKPTAGNTTSQGIYLLAPGDKIDVSYSVAPAMNVIPLNNI